MNSLTHAQISHLYDVHRIRFFPALEEGMSLKGVRTPFEPMSQHPTEGILPLGAFSYSQSYTGGIARIGRYCSIGTGLTIMGDEHPADWVSTNPLFYSAGRYKRFTRELPPYTRGFESAPGPVHIGNDVWIGDNVTLKGGITIHDGAIIAYGAVVTKDVAPYTIVGGLPAGKIRDRFDPELTRALIASEWWTYDVRDLAELTIEAPRQFLSELAFLKDELRILPDCRAKLREFLKSEHPLLRVAA